MAHYYKEFSGPLDKQKLREAVRTKPQYKQEHFKVLWSFIEARRASAEHGTIDGGIGEVLFRCALWCLDLATLLICLVL